MYYNVLEMMMIEMFADMWGRDRGTSVITCNHGRCGGKIPGTGHACSGPGVSRVTEKSDIRRFV